AHLRTTIAGTIDYLATDPRGLTLAVGELAADEAIRQSRIGSPGHFPGPLFAAVPPVEVDWQQREKLYASSDPARGDAYDRMIDVADAANDRSEFEEYLFANVGERLADRFGTTGAPISLSTACASGATAIQLGIEAIRRGETDAALCIGTDGSINPESLIRFSLLSALSASTDPPEQAAKPFAKNRDGFVMAEGAGALVLESLESARARGAKILGVMEGCGEMADAGLTPEDIDYINPHGTGTPENDKMEALGVTAVFGERAKSIPISSNKS